MKKKLVLFLAVLTAALLNTAVFASGDVKVNLNGNMLDFDVPPQIMNGRTMVPMRKIFESLGATVEWNGSTQTITAKKIGTKIIMTVGGSVMKINNREVPLDTPACIIDGRTLVPVRAISDAFGTDVKWDGNNNTVTISRRYVNYQLAFNVLQNGLSGLCNEYGAPFFSRDLGDRGYSMAAGMSSPMISIYQISVPYTFYFDLMFFNDFVSYNISGKNGNSEFFSVSYYKYPNESEWRMLEKNDKADAELREVFEDEMPDYFEMFDGIMKTHNLGCTLADFGVYY